MLAAVTGCAKHGCIGVDGEDKQRVRKYGGVHTTLNLWSSERVNREEMRLGGPSKKGL